MKILKLELLVDGFAADALHKAQHDQWYKGLKPFTPNYPMCTKPKMLVSTLLVDIDGVTLRAQYLTPSYEYSLWIDKEEYKHIVWFKLQDEITAIIRNELNAQAKEILGE